jgi:D-alanyl-D-alanine carboxypeptidase (penicillin-binding protein 5/6)
VIILNIKIKHIITYTLLAFFLVFSTFSAFAYEEEEIDDEEALSLIESLEASSTVSNEPNVDSAHAIAIDRNSGRILYQKSAFDQTPMASTTKILTAIIAIETCNLTDEVSISSKAEHTSGSTLGITANTTMQMEDLLYGLMLRSGNDCAVAIAEHIGGSIEDFATIMNKRAKEIGLTSSHFVTPHGLDNTDHYTTAYDLAILTNYALQNETFVKIVSTKQINICNGTRSISNTNELLGNYPRRIWCKNRFYFWCWKMFSNCLQTK